LTLPLLGFPEGEVSRVAARGLRELPHEQSKESAFFRGHLPLAGGIGQPFSGLLRSPFLPLFAVLKVSQSMPKIDLESYPKDQGVWREPNALRKRSGALDKNGKSGWSS